MNNPYALLPAARFGVEVAARVLRTRADRERYAIEFLAELGTLPPGAQLRYAAGVLSHVFALRAALGTRPFGVKEAAMGSTVRARLPFRCGYVHYHHWQQFNTDDGERYVACSLCLKERMWYRPQIGGWVD